VTKAAPRHSGSHQAFVATVFVLGLAALWDAVSSLHATTTHYHWVSLAALTLLSGAFTIKVPSLSAALSISETFLFFTVLYFGSAPAVIIVALDGLSISLIRRRSEFRHAAFNLAEPTLSMWVASKAYFALAGVAPLAEAPASIGQIGLPALALCAVYFVMNSGLNAIAVATESGASPLSLWKKYFFGVSLNYFGGASIAVLLAANIRTTDLLSSILAVAPLILVSYFTFKASMGRLEDENRHLGDVNRLYLKVVETLAMAVDAKDQVTHGHVRRVQTYALQLARRIGVTDVQELRAIEAAALLHDMGKLAIPEHILNKPGKLTGDEYERMKLHAPLGADMLSAVDFPYPVVPIVRHHHENWDGTGYPDKLLAGAIPIGARVLSVVDCYDALRSDRPYRGALSPAQAMAIVRERRGTMYDPSVVDAFESLQIEVEAETVNQPLPDALDRFAQAAREMRRADSSSETIPLELRVSATEMLLRLYGQLSVLGPAAGIDVTCDTVSRYLLRVAPAGLVVFYRRDDAADEVVAVYASGFGESLVRDARMPMGHGVSGWVAATGRSVINADSALDLGHRLDGIEPKFQSILSIPLMQPRGAVGVVTLYASQAHAFREEQRQAIELISAHVAHAFARALQASREPAPVSAHPTFLGASHGHALDAILAQGRGIGGECGRSLGVLCVKNVGDASVMDCAAMAVSQATRIADLLFTPGDDSIVVLMPDCDAGAGELVVERIAAALPPGVVPPPSASSPLRIAFACSPHDGDSVRQLLDVAQQRLGDRPLPAGAGCPAAPRVAGSAAGGQPWTS
jgi:putative nucleotidyltransferase with HDIG domain